MDFTLSDEQKLLKDSVDRFVAEKYGLDVRRAQVASEDGFSRKNWETFAELGWLAIPFAEASGGLGGGPVEVMVLMEAFGRGLVVEPFISTILTGASLIEALGDDEQKAATLPSVIQGEKLIAFAYVEPQARFTISDIITTATADGDGYRISGHKAVAFGGDSANHLIVSARTSGDQRDKNGISLFLVDAEAAGVLMSRYWMSWWALKHDLVKRGTRSRRSKAWWTTLPPQFVPKLSASWTRFTSKHSSISIPVSNLA